MAGIRRVLDLIQKSDGKDNRELSEIGEETYLFLKQFPPEKEQKIRNREIYVGGNTLRFITSLDALKKLRPQGFSYVKMMNHEGKSTYYQWSVFRPDENFIVEGKAYGATEQLAELAAVLQAIHAVRNKEECNEYPEETIQAENT